jgi:hypothetical protein
MVRQTRPGHPARIAYKVTMSLFPQEWDELKMEAQTRGITGGELVAAVISKWLRDSEAPAPEDQDEPDQVDA